MVVGLDLEHRSPALTDIHRSRVLAGSLDHRRAGGRQPAQQRLRALVRTVLRPEHPEHSELDLVGGPLQLLDDDPVLLGGERHLSEASLVHALGRQETRTFIAFAATERNSFSPSVPPSSGSEHRSGCGIMPSTLPRALTMPAMLCVDPLGFALLVTRPLSSQ